MKIDTGGPAFPLPYDLPIDNGDGRHSWASQNLGQPDKGLTVLDEFAKAAMPIAYEQANHDAWSNQKSEVFLRMAKISYEMAQAMVAEKKRLEAES